MKEIDAVKETKADVSSVSSLSGVTELGIRAQSIGQFRERLWSLRKTRSPSHSSNLNKTSDWQLNSPLIQFLARFLCSYSSPCSALSLWERWRFAGTPTKNVLRLSCGSVFSGLQPMEPRRGPPHLRFFPADVRWLRYGETPALKFLFCSFCLRWWNKMLPVHAWSTERWDVWTPHHHDNLPVILRFLRECLVQDENARQRGVIRRNDVRVNSHLWPGPTSGLQSGQRYRHGYPVLSQLLPGGSV